MIPLSIHSATAVYEDSAQCEIVRHWVDHAGLAEVSHSLRILVQSLGDEATDQFWTRTLGPLRRAAFAMCSTPLPFAQLGSIAGLQSDQMQRLVRQCQQMYPDSHAQLSSVVLGLEGLLSENNSPLIEPLELLHRNYGALSVILRNPRMNRVVADCFAGSRNLWNAKVVSASQLRGAHHGTALVAIGPCGWFPEFVFSAPRASAVHIVSYRWIRDNWKPATRFLHNSNVTTAQSSRHCIGAMPRISGGVTEHAYAADDVQAPDLLPPLPTFALGGLPNSNSPPHDFDELVRARLCQLAGDRAVLIAADEGASSLIIDASEMGRTSVRRVRIDELEQGMYLLLRTAGGGDFIVPLADRILGASAAKLRSEQVEWKDRLMRSAIERFGALSRRDLSSLVCTELHSQGLSHVRPAHVHYWMSSKCIRPRQSEDFAAVIKWAGLEDRAQSLWTAMGEIDRAHRRAGHLIRRMLLQKIAETSLDPLERDGEFDFELGEQGGGSISAYQITDIAAEELDVPLDRINLLLDMEE